MSRKTSNNTLINGAGAVMVQPPVPGEVGETIPTFGYKGSEAKLFDLKPGEALPNGWADRPNTVMNADSDGN